MKAVTGIFITAAFVACCIGALFSPGAVAAIADNTPLTVTVDASGDATAYSGKVFNGRLVAIKYAKTNYANGVDFTITSETTGQTLWTESDVNSAAIKYPLTAAHSTVGVAVTYDGTRPILVPVALVNERIKVIVGSGGVSTSGAFTFVVEGY